MNQKYQLTMEGFKDIQERLKYLKDVEREKNIIALQEARAQGDLSENADYDAARDQQAKIASEISELEKIIKNAEIIKDETNNLGKTLKIGYYNSNYKRLEDCKEAEEKAGFKFDDVDSYKIVGSLEADPLRGLISNESPLGHAIVNHKVGDIIKVKPENGEDYFVKIIGITK